MTRDEFRMKFDRCFVCGAPGTDIHEICRGPHRKKAIDNAAALIKTCRGCHSGALAAMPIARQLAIKLLYDPENYDRQEVNRIRSRAPDAITEKEVAVEVVKFLMIRGRL